MAAPFALTRETKFAATADSSRKAIIKRRHRRSAIGLILAVPEGVSSRLDRPSTRTEILVGRSLAMCVHPYAAWRSHSARGRLLVFAAYLGVSSVLFLGGLLVSF